MNRPDKSNAMNRAFWRCAAADPRRRPLHAQRRRLGGLTGFRALSSEIKECFDALAADSSCRAIILSGAGKNFTGGLDLADHIELFSGGEDKVGLHSVTLLPGC